MSFKLLIYNRECMDLTRSLLIKSDLLARDVEYLLTENTDYLDVPREHWKYYMNISGEYHSTNERMFITSLDTLTTIEFTKEVLVDHPITKEKYGPTDSLTKDLMVRYPENLLLIMGIIYGIDKGLAIGSDEFTILAYDRSLVGVQEINLMPELQQRLYSEYRNYLNKDYADIEPYYAVVAMAFIAKQARQAIKAIRLSNYKTTRACDYYIWSYINSKLYLEDLKDNFNREDIFYLYKNIDRLTRKAGSNEVLLELINQFLTRDRISTYRLNLTRDTTLIDELDAKTDTVYLEVPLVTDSAAKNADINEYVEMGGERGERQLTDYESTLDRRHRTTLDDVPTRELKVYEVVKDATDTQLLLTDIDIFLDGVVNGYYNDIYSIPDHVNSKVYNMTALEAFIFYTYIIRRKLGAEVGYIPKHSIYLAPRPSRPSALQLANEYHISTLEAEKILDAIVPYPDSVLSQNELVDYTAKVKSTFHDVVRHVRRNTTRTNQAKITRIYDELYFTGEYDLVKGDILYTDWLAARNINLDDLNELDFTILEAYMLEYVFNIDLSTRSSHYALGITELISRLNNYRVNIRTQATSNNLIDYHISPIYSSIERLDVQDFYVPVTATIEQHATFYDYMIGLQHTVISPMRTDTMLNHNTALVKCNFSAQGYKSEVITPMSTHYHTEIQLRNSDVS